MDSTKQRRGYLSWRTPFNSSAALIELARSHTMAASDAAMAASGAVHAAVHSVTTSGTSLPAFYTYFGERGCSEHVSIMRQAWSDEGWRVHWVSALKAGPDYKVTVTYGMPDDKERSFTETICKEANAEWKPSGVSIQLSEETNKMVVHWWRRTALSQIKYRAKRLRIDVKDLPNDLSEGASADGGDVAPRSLTDRQAEMAVDSYTSCRMSVPFSSQTIPEEVPVPSTTSSSSSSAGGDPPSSPTAKRLRTTDEDSESV